MAEWTTENEFDRPSTVQVPSKYRPSTAQVPPKIDDTVNAQVNISKLTDRQRNIYKIIKRSTGNVQINDQINVPNLTTLFQVSEKTIRRDLDVLREMNLIKPKTVIRKNK